MDRWRLGMAVVLGYAVVVGKAVVWEGDYHEGDQV